MIRVFFKFFLLTYFVAIIVWTLDDIMQYEKSDFKVYIRESRCKTAPFDCKNLTLKWHLASLSKRVLWFCSLSRTTMIYHAFIDFFIFIPAALNLLYLLLCDYFQSQLVLPIPVCQAIATSRDHFKRKVFAEGWLLQEALSISRFLDSKDLWLEMV